ncbi:MAG: hypothetical protein LBR45_01175 [Bacteroidales bacterium]|nr:hypothetical protein [Bacteroidales bacterium]
MEPTSFLLGVGLCVEAKRYRREPDPANVFQNALKNIFKELDARRTSAEAQGAY